MPSTSLRQLVWWSLCGCTVLAAVLTLGDRPTVVLAVAVVVAGAAATLLFHHAVYGGGPARVAPLAAVGALAAGAGFTGAQVTGAGLWPWCTLPALTTAGLLAATRLPRVATAGGAALLSGAVVAAVRPATALPDAVVAAAATAACIAALLAQLWIGDLAARDRNREAAAAVVRERLRFAAELHDIQGHSLQVIVLKSELAARLAERDMTRAAAEMREVETLARDALRDTREVVHGYRTVSFGTEVGNAVRVLAAAGIACRTSLPTEDVPGPAAHLLARVVREATTNIIRYGSTGPADITLTASLAGLRLTVGNTTDPTVPHGHAGGLADLAARLEAAAGTLNWARAGDRFELVADLPAVS